VRHLGGVFALGSFVPISALDCRRPARFPASFSILGDKDRRGAERGAPSGRVRMSIRCVSAHASNALGKVGPSHPRFGHAQSRSRRRRALCRPVVGASLSGQARVVCPLSAAAERSGRYARSRGALPSPRAMRLRGDVADVRCD